MTAPARQCRRPFQGTCPCALDKCCPTACGLLRLQVCKLPNADQCSLRAAEYRCLCHRCLTGSDTLCACCSVSRRHHSDESGSGAGQLCPRVPYKGVCGLGFIPCLHLDWRDMLGTAERKADWGQLHPGPAALSACAAQCGPQYHADRHVLGMFSNPTFTGVS